MSFGLSLAGGGIRGATHVGVLKALEEENLRPRSISGTSAGSIVAGLYAAGIPVSDLEKLVIHLMTHGRSYIDLDYLSLIGFIPQIFMQGRASLSGFIKGNRFSSLFFDLTDGINIKDVPMSLVIPAVDLYSGYTICFTNETDPLSLPQIYWERDVPLCEAIMASCSIPAIFRPRLLRKYLLVDGGVTNSLPVDLLRAANEPNIIAVDLDAPHAEYHNTSILEVITHSFSIMSHSLKECNSISEALLLKPKLPKGANLLAFGYMDECMEAGYQYTKKMMPQIRKTIG